MAMQNWFFSHPDVQQVGLINIWVLKWFTFYVVHPIARCAGRCIYLYIIWRHNKQ
jgi:hypothetical protein